MTEESEIQDSEEAPAEPKGPTGGERLAEARRELKISVHEIAKELHLDEPKVRALERNEFDVLGAPVFAKGHLKKYAQLVNVDPNDMMADYYVLTRSAELPPVISMRTRPRRELTPGPWIAVIVVIIIAATVYWWVTRPVELEVIEPPGIADETSFELPTDADEAPEPSSEQVLEDTAPQAVEPIIPEQPEVDNTPPVDDGQLRILVTYTGDCWTEITDATGRRLLFALGRDGRTVELSGAEPFNVLFGNPGNVRLQVNGEDYALPPGNRPDRPMRLTLSGS